MKRALLAVSALLVACVGGLIVVVVAGREEERLAVDNLLAENLSLEVARAQGNLRLADVTGFPWDSVLIVERGTPREAIDARVEGGFDGGVNFETGDLLVFLRDGRVTRYADYRGEGRFEGVERPIDEFSREDAVFEVENLVITPKEP